MYGPSRCTPGVLEPFGLAAYSFTHLHTSISVFVPSVSVVGSHVVTPSFILQSAIVRMLSTLQSQVSHPPAPCEWMSMNPGSSMLPPASTTLSAAGVSPSGYTAAILVPSIRTDAPGRSSPGDIT